MKKNNIEEEYNYNCYHCNLFHSYKNDDEDSEAATDECIVSFVFLFCSMPKVLSGEPKVESEVFDDLSDPCLRS